MHRYVFVVACYYGPLCKTAQLILQFALKKKVKCSSSFGHGTPVQNSENFKNKLAPDFVTSYFTYDAVRQVHFTCETLYLVSKCKGNKAVLFECNKSSRSQVMKLIFN